MSFLVSLWLVLAAGDASVLHLDEVVQLALQNQPTLRAAQAQAAGASAQANQARAPLLPQVSAQASYARGTANSSSRTTLGGVTAEPTGTSYDSFAAGISASQLIYDFGESWGRFRSAASGAEAERYAVQASELDVVYQARAAFFTARAAKDLARVARESLDNQARHLEQVQAFVAVGRRPEIDLVQSRAEKANAQVQSIQATASLATARARLEQLAGVPLPREAIIADDTLSPVDGEQAELATLIDEALTKRPELRRLETQVLAREQARSSARGAYLPRLSAQGSFTESGPALSELAWNWSVGLVASWGLFQGGATTAAVDAASAGVDVATQQLESAKLQVKLEVEQAQLAVVSAQASLTAADEALENAKVRLQLAEARYATGVGTILELGDAQVALTSTAAQRVQADYALATARAQLARALGRR